LCRFPFLTKTGGLSGEVQLQFLNDSSHSREVDVRAIIEIYGRSWT
jgi:hypothetical protein